MDQKAAAGPADLSTSQTKLSSALDAPASRPAQRLSLSELFMAMRCRRVRSQELRAASSDRVDTGEPRLAWTMH